VYCNPAIVVKIVTAVDSLRANGGVTVKKHLKACDMRSHLLHSVVDNHICCDVEIKSRARELCRRLKERRKKFWLF
jgi:hypothetical protein